MNNKGFSILELIVSFSICMVVVFVLFQIVVVLKEVYEKSTIKTEMLNKRNLIVDQIYTDILEKKINTVQSCGNKCAEFLFEDGTSKTLNSTAISLQYGDYTTELNSGTTIQNVDISNISGIISVHMEINHKLFANTDFGIHVVHCINCVN